MLWRCWLGGRKGIWPVKHWVVGCWHGYLSGARCRLAYGLADATVSCFSKIQIGFTILVLAYLDSPRQRAVKLECMCVMCVYCMSEIKYNKCKGSVACANCLWRNKHVGGPSVSLCMTWQSQCWVGGTWFAATAFHREYWWLLKTFISCAFYHSGS